MKNLSYWYCVIGPIDRDALPPGADGIPRIAVQEAYEVMTKSVDYTCSSGWGITEEMKQAMFFARTYPKEILKFIEEGNFRK